MRFVVHEHQSSHHHFDLRLEFKGILKSWAVPKGPSLNPKERRLAIQVPDHPFEYGSWEGIIPQGNYGAGAVAIWDQGEYRYSGDEDPEVQWGKGSLSFELFGQRLKGCFSLVKLRRGESGHEWLLIKKKDAFAKENGEAITILTPERLSQLKQEKPPCQMA